MDDRIDDLLSEEARDYNEPPATPRAEMWERIRAARGGTTGRRDDGTVAPAADVIPITHVPSSRRPLVPSYIRIAIGIAALLALGIGIGRWMERSAASPSSIAQQPAKQLSPDSGVTVTVPDNGTAAPEVAAAPKRQLRGGTPVIAAGIGGRNAARGDIAYSMALSQHLGQSETFLTLFRSSVRAGHIEPVAFSTARHLLGTNRLLLDSRIGADPHTRLLLEDLELVLAQIAQLNTTGDSSDVHIITEDMDQGDVLPRLRIAVPAGT